MAVSKIVCCSTCFSSKLAFWVSSSVFLKVFIPLKPENIFCSKDKVLFSESIFVSERFVPLWLVLLVEVVLVCVPSRVIFGKNSLLEIFIFCLIGINLSFIL